MNMSNSHTFEFVVFLAKIGVINGYVDSMDWHTYGITSDHIWSKSEAGTLDAALRVKNEERS